MIVLEMPEKLVDKTLYSLKEVADSIQKSISDRYQGSYWIKAELAKLNQYPHSGHCYPDLVEKKEERVIAQIRGNLWVDDYYRINRNFLRIANEPLRDGINILFEAQVKFHPVHGLALRIIDIYPQYTLGEMAREKQETIRKLKEENLFDTNKKLSFPMLPQRVAVISVETSKGYSDFTSKIDQNPWGYKFFYMLFPSLLQGEKAVDSIINQLSGIKRVASHFDVVTIIRGGGGDVGLSCYDNYRLAREIALFPLPVLTGIGHATNETVVEMLSYKNSITPTDLADYLIQKFHDFSVPVKENQQTLIMQASILLENENKKFYENIRVFRYVTRQSLTQHLNGILTIANSFKMHLGQFFTEAGKDLHGLQEKARLLDPANVLKRGYSITYFKGSVLTKSKAVKKADRIITRLHEGEIESIVDSNKELKK
ncbi:MAG: exodeoxyribonuclease VII large subunit [Bacteroidales bacterium]|nr:exodeoxyribonuclease VII large subunit [Bacteroidales bacterium]